MNLKARWNQRLKSRIHKAMRVRILQVRVLEKQSALIDDFLISIEKANDYKKLAKKFEAAYKADPESNLAKANLITSTFWFKQAVENAKSGLQSRERSQALESRVIRLEKLKRRISFGLNVEVYLYKRVF